MASILDEFLESPFKVDSVSDSFNDLSQQTSGQPQSQPQEFGPFVEKNGSEYVARFDLDGDGEREATLNEDSLAKALETMRLNDESGSPIYNAYSDAYELVRSSNLALKGPESPAL